MICMAKEKFLKITLNQDYQIWWAPDWTEKEFHSSVHRYVIVAGWGHFLRSFEVLTHFLSVPQQITPAPYNSHIDLAIQTLYISQNYQHLSDCVRRERCGRKPVSIACWFRLGKHQDSRRSQFLTCRFHQCGIKPMFTQSNHFKYTLFVKVFLKLNIHRMTGWLIYSI